MIQVVECLPIKCEILNSDLSAEKNKLSFTLLMEKQNG